MLGLSRLYRRASGGVVRGTVRVGGGALSAGGESGPCFGELGAGLLSGL